MAATAGYQAIPRLLAQPRGSDPWGSPTGLCRLTRAFGVYSVAAAYGCDRRLSGNTSAAGSTTQVGPMGFSYRIVQSYRCGGCLFVRSSPWLRPQAIWQYLGCWLNHAGRTH